MVKARFERTLVLILILFVITVLIPIGVLGVTGLTLFAAETVTIEGVLNVPNSNYLDISASNSIGSDFGSVIINGNTISVSASSEEGCNSYTSSTTELVVKNISPVEMTVYFSVSGGNGTVASPQTLEPNKSFSFTVTSPENSSGSNSGSLIITNISNTIS